MEYSKGSFSKKVYTLSSDQSFPTNVGVIKDINQITITINQLLHVVPLFNNQDYSHVKDCCKTLWTLVQKSIASNSSSTYCLLNAIILCLLESTDGDPAILDSNLSYVYNASWFMDYLLQINTKYKLLDTNDQLRLKSYKLISELHHVYLKYQVFSFPYANSFDSLKQLLLKKLDSSSNAYQLLCLVMYLKFLRDSMGSKEVKTLIPLIHGISDVDKSIDFAFKKSLFIASIEKVTILKSFAANVFELIITAVNEKSETATVYYSETLSPRARNHYLLKGYSDGNHMTSSSGTSQGIDTVETAVSSNGSKLAGPRSNNVDSAQTKGSSTTKRRSYDTRSKGLLEKSTTM